MAKKKQIKFRPDKKVIEADGIIYRAKKSKKKMIDGIEHTDYIIFEELDQKDYDAKLQFIKNKLAGKITAGRVIEEVFRDVGTIKVDRVYKLLKQKNAKIKKHDGCLGFKIEAGKKGSAYLQIYD